MKSYAKLLNLSLLVLLLAGVACAAQNSRSDDRRERAGSTTGWELLGRQDVQFKSDHDRIDVPRSDRRYRRLQLRVEGAPVEIEDMVVTFGDGEKFRPKLRHRFQEGDRTKDIDLPGDVRRIVSIDFNYRSVDKDRGKAVVSVYGR